MALKETQSPQVRPNSKPVHQAGDVKHLGESMKPVSGRQRNRLRFYGRRHAEVQPSLFEPTSWTREPEWSTDAHELVGRSRRNRSLNQNRAKRAGNRSGRAVCRGKRRRCTHEQPKSAERLTQN